MSEPIIRISSTSLTTADVSPVVLRGDQSEERRLVYKPMLVANVKEAAAAVRGTFVYQRKRRGDEWYDVATIGLNSLKAGEGYKLELTSAETLHLYKALSELYGYVEAQGLEVGRRELVPVDQADVVTEVIAMLEGGNARSLVEGFIRWARCQDGAELVDVLAGGDKQGLINFDAAVAAARLQQFLSEARANLNGDEDYWQGLLTENAWALSQVYAHPLVIIREQAYVGGKGIDNCGGSVVDYLFRNTLTYNALLIEIKTPQTRLLTLKEYRNGVYGPSQELGGATQQLLHATQTLRDDFTSLTRDRPGDFNIFSPRALLVIGTLPEASDAVR